MKRGVVASQVQQMMGGSHGWWWSRSSDSSSSDMMRSPLPPQISPLLPPPPSSSPSPSTPSSSPSPSCPFPSGSTPLFSWPPAENQDHLPESWSQLLLGGQIGEEEKISSLTTFPTTRKVEINWEDPAPYQPTTDRSTEGVVLLKHESMDERGGGYMCGFGGGGETQAPPAATARCSWGQALPVSSPKSCVTFGGSMLDFSGGKADRYRDGDGGGPKPDHSTECNSTETGSAPKKARVQGSSSAAQSPFKVRKEKLGDRITVLHQLVSPFGKTDTASVLLEAIGYIRFLQSQIEALSSPYLGNAAAAHGNTSHAGQGERCCIFPEDPGQLLNDACMKMRGSTAKDFEPKRDLKSRGLCLVPISCTMHVSSENAADYWAPAMGGGYR